eukprot:5079279-Pyramimonas_sp.AAC.1
MDCEEQYGEGNMDVKQFVVMSSDVEVPRPSREYFYKFDPEDYPTRWRMRRELSSSMAAYEELR